MKPEKVRSAIFLRLSLQVFADFGQLNLFTGSFFLNILLPEIVLSQRNRACNRDTLKIIKLSMCFLVGYTETKQLKSNNQFHGHSLQQLLHRCYSYTPRYLLFTQRKHT